MNLVVISLGIVLEAVVVGQLQDKVVVLVPIAHHRLTPFPVIRSAYYGRCLVVAEVILQELALAIVLPVAGSFAAFLEFLVSQNLRTAAELANVKSSVNTKPSCPGFLCKTWQSPSYRRL